MRPLLPSLAPIALQDDPADVLRAAVDSVRKLTRVDRAFAAVARGPGRYPISVRHGLIDPRWARVVVRQGRGLGGRVVAERRTVVTPSYRDDATITGDYRTIVDAEGLQSVACVPVIGADGVAALLYAGDRRAGGFGDRMLEELERVADIATVGLTLAAQRAAARESLRAISGIAREGIEGDDPTKLREALASIVATCSGVPSAKASSIRLTPREQDVLALLADGASNRQIAARLVISEPTVKEHVRALLRKLDAGSRLEAIARARRAGLA